MNLVSLSHNGASSHNGATAAVLPTSWQQTSVQVFFSNINWEDHPPEIQEIKLASSQNSTAPLSANLSVSQFFSAINWDGNEIAAPVQSLQQPISEPTESLTLDDFFGLF